MSMNPYRFDSSTTDASQETTAAPRGRLATLLRTILIGCVSAVVVGEIMSVTVLIPPLNGWFSMDGEFDGLILIGMPIWAGGFSLLSSFVLGLLHPRRGALQITLVIHSIIMSFFAWNMIQSAHNSSGRYSAVTVSVIGWIAVCIGMVIAERSLSRIGKETSDV